MAKLNDPKIEKYKDWLRIGVFFILAWIATEILKQKDLIIEFYNLKVWGLTFAVPVRNGIVAGIGIFLTWYDRIKYLKDGRGLTLGN